MADSIDSTRPDRDDRYVTAREAGRIVGVPMHVILTAIRRGKLAATLRLPHPEDGEISSTRAGREVPLNMIRIGDLRHAFRNRVQAEARKREAYETNLATGGGQRASGSAKQPAQLDAMRSLRSRLEKEREARECGISVEDLCA